MSANATAQTSTAPLSNLSPVHQAFFEAKAKKGLTFEQIGKEIGRDEVWVSSLFYAQAKPHPKDIVALAKVLDIETNFVSSQLGEHWFPNRGIGPVPPTDPVLYRLYEAVLVYGHPIKAVLHEKFGDGIISMIDCKIHVDKRPDPKGDRVILTFDGKFLPYATW